MNTYDELSAAVTAYAGQVGNSEFTNMVPNFISMGESDIYRVLRHPSMITDIGYVDLDIASLPVDFLEAAYVYCGDTILEYQLPTVLFDNLVNEGTPTAWTIVGNDFWLNADTTGAGTDVNLYYYAKPPELSVQVNNIFLLNQDLFLYAALCHAMIYLRDEQRQSIWASLFDKKVQELNASGWHYNIPKHSPLKMRTV